MKPTYEQLEQQNAALREEVAFERDMRKLAQSAAATIADFDEVAPALRQMLRVERDRRHKMEAELDRVGYELQQLSGYVEAVDERD